MMSRRSIWVGLALLVPSPLLAQAASAPPANEFRELWTGWSGANAASLTIERQSVDRVREDYVSAGSVRRHQLQNEGRALGERVGEIVRLGDCAEGERVARAAGDFALVQAVRSHCRTTAAPER